MFGYIKGKVKEINNTNIVIENNNIGYIINVPNPYNYILEEEYKVYTYNHIRENENTLYGFQLKEEKDLFLKLITVKGLGPKTAVPFFASSDYENIENAIEAGNVIYLKKFPRVGDKLAGQIILDLKGKLNLTEKAPDDEELTEVLSNLGYTKTVINRVISQVDKSLSLEDKIKEALKLMIS